MKIIYICNEYPPFPHGGIGVFIKNLSENLVQKAINCTVIGIYDQHEKYKIETVYGVEIRRIKKKKWLIGKLHPVIQLTLERYQLSQEIEKLELLLKPDIIESYDWTGPLFKKPRAPLVVRLHGSNSAHSVYERRKISKYLYFWEKKNLKFADRIISVSKFMLKSTAYAFKLKIFPEIVIYNFIDHSQFYYNNTIFRDPNKILFVGKFHARKGVFALFKILNYLLPLKQEYFFEFVGNHTEEQKRQLLALLKPNLHSRINFINAIPHNQLMEVYNSATLMIMPSKAEAFGLTAIEAMACGCIVAMTNCATGPELITNEVDGILINPEEHEKSAIKLHSILSNCDLVGKIRTAALEKSKYFGKENIILQNIAFYRSIVKGNEI